MTYRAEKEMYGYRVITDPKEGEFFDVLVLKKKGTRLNNPPPTGRVTMEAGLVVNVSEPDAETEALAHRVADLLNTPSP